MSLTKEQALRKEVKKLSDDLKATRKLIVKLDLQVLSKEAALKKAEKALDALEPGPPEISEHAMLRYLERVTGIDMDMIKKAILPPGYVIPACPEGGEGERYNLGTHTIVVKGNTVVSVL